MMIVQLSGHPLVRNSLSFHFLFTHGVIGSVVVEDHGALVGTLKGLVASAAACETLDGTCLDGLIDWSCR